MKDYAGQLKHCAEAVAIQQRCKSLFTFGCRGPGGLFHRETGAKRRVFRKQPHLPRWGGTLGARISRDLPVVPVSGGAAAGAGALAFVVHGPDRAGTRGLQSFYRFGPLFNARDKAAGFTSGAGHDSADELSTERRDAGGSDAPLCRPAGERHCRAERVSADDAAANDSGPGGGRHDASRRVVEGAAADCRAGSDHTPAGERREDTGGGAAPIGGTPGMEEAVSGESQISEARHGAAG